MLLIWKKQYDLSTIGKYTSVSTKVYTMSHIGSYPQIFRQENILEIT